MSDRTDELVAVMESLADYLDNYGEYTEVVYFEAGDGEEHVAAVAQIIELTQLLMAEYQETRQVVDDYLRSIQTAKNLIKTNAGPASKLIVP
jgi:hypothetical protein